MRELLMWIDRVNALRAASTYPRGMLRSHLYLAEQLLEDEARNLRFRVLLKATNILMDDKELEPEDGVYRVNFTR